MFRLKVRKFWRGEEVKAAIVKTALQVNMEAGEYMLQRAKEGCPVDTGFLKASIRLVVTMGGARVSVIAEAPYAIYVEFGSLHGGTWIAPRPFMRNAYFDTARQYPEIAKRVMQSSPLGGSGKHLGFTIAA
jgi:HK97 gp10 family phage protein